MVKYSDLKFTSIVALILIIVVTFFYYQLKNTEIDCSYNNEKIKHTVLNGKVKRKYIDTKNHNYQLFILQTKYSVDTIAWESDKSDFYLDMEINDSVIKEVNSLSIVLKNNNKFKEYVIDYGCD